MTGTARNVRLYPWMKFCQNFITYQAIWFLFFQEQLSAAEAILLYVVYDAATFALEVPSGYMSDRLGRKVTLLVAAAAGTAGGLFLTIGETFVAFACAQACLGAASAFASGTDSAILYESLAVEGREGDVEVEEVRAWRATFTALAISAVLGGALALLGYAISFAVTAASFGAMLLIVLAMVEPDPQSRKVGNEWDRVASLRRAFHNPVLLWLFALGVLMYAFSHVPFVFGQPFIETALSGVGYDEEAPLVSGAVTAVMMLLSVAASWAAPALRERLGLAVLVTLAFAMQVGIAGALALWGSVLAIPILFLRMVPNAFSSAFIIARIQPELASDSRATWLSVRSLAGRLFFVLTLLVSTLAVSERAEMTFPELRVVLGGYAFLGLIALAALIFAARGLPLDRVRTTAQVP